MTGRRPRRQGLALVALVALAAAVAGGAAGLQYVDATDEWGVDFRTAGEVHSEESDWPAFPEIMGAGACVADLDGDGYDDVYVVNQRYNPQNPATDGWIGTVNPTNELYLNAGNGTFEEATAGSGAANTGWGYGCSAADYDGDGDVDLHVANFGPNALYENTGNATFRNVTAAAGVSGADRCGDHLCMSTSSAWGDHDGDGDLDLYVGNYVDTNRTDKHRGPMDHQGQHNFLYRNDGDGTFTPVADEAGVQGRATDLLGSKTLGVVWFDADDDGDQDLYVANDEVENDYYENAGDGTFRERSRAAGLADTRAGMGVAAASYDRDRHPDLLFTHYASETNGFYRNAGDGTFEDRSGEDDQVNSVDKVGWGVGFDDADRDGDLDILLANGHTEWSVDDYGQPFQAYRHDRVPSTGSADADWVDASGTWGLSEAPERVTRGMALGDLDRDGDTDAVAVSNANETAQVLEARGEVGNHLTVELNQSGPNPDAVGARVTVTVDGTAHHRTVRAGSSYLSQNSLARSFGLGSAPQADEVAVRWPDGGTTTVQDVAAGQVIRVDRATGSYVNDSIAPVSQVEVLGDEGARGWFTSPVNVTVDARDRGVTAASGVDRVEHALGDDPWTRYGDPVALDEGVHRFHHRAADAAGNVEPRTTTVVRVDRTPPTAQHAVHGEEGRDGWRVSDPVNVTLSGDDALSGVHRITYSLDGGPWRPYTDPVALSEDGVREVRYRVHDRAGLVSERSLTVKVDSTPPDLGFASPSPGGVYLGDHRVAALGAGPAYIVAAEAGDVGTRFPVTVEGGDPASGLDELRLAIDGSPQPPARSASPATWTWDVSAEPAGAHLLEAAGTDQAGNEAALDLRVLLAAATEDGVLATAGEGPADGGIGPGLT